MQRIFACALAIALLFSGSSMAADFKIGDEAPSFVATNVDGKEVSFDQISKESEVTVVAFTCNSCPVAMAYEDRFIEFTEAYKDKKVTFIAINCNSRSENLEAMKRRAEEKGFNFIYAYDESGSTAKAFGARVTPELFVIKSGKLAYHGSFDDKQKDPTKHYVAKAVDALLAGNTPEVAETKAFGCGIKSK